MHSSVRLPLDVCYGSLAFFQSVLHNIFLLYHVDVFVSVYKIDKTSFWIGETIFLIWNSLNDPFFGWISDKDFLSNLAISPTNSDTVSKRLRALQINGPLFAISFLLFWFPWGYAPLQFVICLCLYDSFLTMIDLHHSALLADLVISAEIRTKLNWKSSLFSAIGSLSVFVSYAVWRRDNMHTFRMFCIGLSVCAIIGFYVMISLLRQAFQRNSQHFEYTGSGYHSHERNEHVVHDGGTPKFRSYLTQLFKQKNFVLFSVMNLIQVFHCHFNSNFFPLFLDNLLGSSISPGFGSFLIGVSFIAPHINNLYFLSLCGRYGVYTVIKLLFCVKLAISVIMFCVGPGSVAMLCLFIASNRVFTEGTCKLLNLVISDLVDEDFVVHGRKKAASALMFGTAALVSKPGQTLAPLVGTWFLSLQTGHDIFQAGNELGRLTVDSEAMSAEVLEQHRQGCFNLLVYIPIVCAVIQLAVWTQFSLHGRRLRKIKSLRAGAEHSII